MKDAFEIKTDKKPFVIGLTGGIGGGKSAAAQILGAKGAYIIDADAVSKRVSAPGTECNERLKAAFPTCVADGVLQRSLLKKLVFSDMGSLKLLNSITHPYILAAITDEARNKGLVAVEASLLFESGFNRLCDVTLGIFASLTVRRERVIKRDNIAAQLADSIMGAQLDQNELRNKCDYRIDNDGDIKLLEDRVEEFIGWLKIHFKARF
jgi:dephospho-CoA kinase